MPNDGDDDDDGGDDDADAFADADADAGGFGDDDDDTLSKICNNNSSNKLTFQAAFPPSAAPRHQTWRLLFDEAKLNWPMKQRDQTQIFRTEHENMVQ